MSFLPYYWVPVREGPNRYPPIFYPSLPLCLPNPPFRVIEYEARATAALQQAIDEESRVGVAQREADAELQATAEARGALQGERAALEAEAQELVLFAGRLQVGRWYKGSDCARGQAAIVHDSRRGRDHPRTHTGRHSSSPPSSLRPPRSPPPGPVRGAIPLHR